MTGGAHAGARRPERLAAELALWTGAVLGLLCILGALAAVVLDVRPMVVQSGSMSPAIPTGSLVLTVQSPADEIADGDVVSVVNGQGTRITHRVVETAAVGAPGTGPLALTLQGDANPTPDAEPYLVDSVDRVFADVPFAGYVVAWASGPVGMLLLGGVAALLTLSVLRAGPRRGVQAVAAAAVVATVAGTWLVPSVRPVGTQASFTDPATVEVPAGSATVPTPPGAVGCTNGAAFSGQLTLSWTAVTGQSSRYRYRVEIHAASGLSSNLLASYVLTGTSQVVRHADLARDFLWSGVASVRVLGTVDGSTWRSAGDIRRTIWVGLTGSDYRCQF